MFGFAAAKLLGFLPFGNLLKGGTGKLILIGMALVAALFLYWKWKDSIKEAVYNEIFAQQVETHLENQRKELEQLKRITAQREQAILDLIEQQKVILRDTSELVKRIESGNLEDGPVAPVLREAVEGLRSRLEPEGEKLLNSAPRAPKRTGNAVIDEFLNLGGSGDE